MGGKDGLARSVASADEVPIRGTSLGLPRCSVPGARQERIIWPTHLDEKDMGRSRESKEQGPHQGQCTVQQLEGSKDEEERPREPREPCWGTRDVYYRDRPGSLQGGKDGGAWKVGRSRVGTLLEGKGRERETRHVMSGVEHTRRLTR